MYYISKQNTKCALVKTVYYLLCECIYVTLVLMVIPCELVFHRTPFFHNLSVYSLPLQLRVLVYVRFCYSCILASYYLCNFGALWQAT